MAVDLRRPIWLALALLLGATAGLLLLGRGRASELTAERLAEARRIWEIEAPSSYRLEIEMGGALDDLRTVVVRDGRVVGMTAGGIDVSPSAWEYWSVDALFDVLRTELDNAAGPRAAAGGRQVALLARFDPSWGYPSYFYRHIMGTNNDVEWKIVGFTPE